MSLSILVLLGIAFLPVDGMSTSRVLAQSDCRQSLTMNRDPESSNIPIVVLMDELQKNPDRYYGKTVTVDGELHRTFTSNVFTIEGEGFLRDKDILVVSTVSKAEAVVALEHSLDSGKDVRVTGLVQPYDRGRLECAYGPLHLDSREGHSFTKNPVLIVDRTEPARSAIAPVQFEKPALEIPMPIRAKPEPVIPEPAKPEAVAPEPAKAEAVTAETRMPESTMPAAAPAKPTSLPRTAGNLPLLALAGLLALLGGLTKSAR